MIKKFILLIILFVSFSSCGYSPVHVQNTDLNFNIKNYKLIGNKEINNHLENKIKKYLNVKNDKSFSLEINTNFKKLSAARDATGKTTNLKLICELNLKIIEENLEKNIFFSETMTVKKIDSNYDQSDYEKNSIKNMSELLFNRLVFYLSTSK